MLKDKNNPFFKLKQIEQKKFEIEQDFNNKAGLIYDR